MPYVVRQFDTAREMTDYLNDAVVGKPISTGKIYGLDGLTLIINDGVDKTVTFADPTEEGLSLKDIFDQIASDQPTLAGKVLRRSYRPTTPPTVQLVVEEATYIVKGAGTANALLGFGGTDVTAGANSVAIADIVQAHTDEGGNKFTLIHQ